MDRPESKCCLKKWLPQGHTPSADGPLQGGPGDWLASHLCSLTLCSSTPRTCWSFSTRHFSEPLTHGSLFLNPCRPTSTWLLVTSQESTPALFLCHSPSGGIYARGLPACAPSTPRAVPEDREPVYVFPYFQRLAQCLKQIVLISIWVTPGNSITPFSTLSNSC